MKDKRFVLCFNEQPFKFSITTISFCNWIMGSDWWVNSISSTRRQGVPFNKGRPHNDTQWTLNDDRFVGHLLQIALRVNAYTHNGKLSKVLLLRGTGAEVQLNYLTIKMLLIFMEFWINRFIHICLLVYILSYLVQAMLYLKIIFLILHKDAWMVYKDI